MPRLFQSLKKGLHNSVLVETILTDLSKAYDCFPHDLLITKLETYALDKPGLKLVNGYLRFRKQMEKIGSSFSDWANVTRVSAFLIALSTIFSYLFKIVIYINLLTVTYCSLVEIISQ